MHFDYPETKSCGGEIMARKKRNARNDKTKNNSNNMLKQEIKDEILAIITIAPVSYTHLDVYKRQVLSLIFVTLFSFSLLASNPKVSLVP